jgi:hypothetical protein
MPRDPAAPPSLLSCALSQYYCSHYSTIVVAGLVLVEEAGSAWQLGSESTAKLAPPFQVVPSLYSLYSLTRSKVGSFACARKSISVETGI